MEITGTLKYISDPENELVQEFGAGNFIALKLTLPEGVSYTQVSAGMNPSAGTGLIPLDEDCNGVWKVSNKNSQMFETVTVIDGVSVVKDYSLRNLVLETE